MAGQKSSGSILVALAIGVIAWFGAYADDARAAVGGPDMQVTSVLDTPDPANATGTLVYDIEAVNSGDADATTVVVTTPVPAGTTFIAVNDVRCSLTGGAVQCAFGTVTESTTLNYQITLRVTAAGGSTVTTTTTVTSDADIAPLNNTQTQLTTINAGADLALALSGTATTVGGGPVSYGITVTNNGPDAVVNARVTNTLPPAVTYVAAGSGGSGWTCSPAGQVITCVRADAQPAGALPLLTINGTVTGASSGTITNSATVDSAAGTFDGLPANNTATFDTAITAGTDLSITKTASAPQIAGLPVTFTLLPRNNGPAAAANVVVTDTLPAGYTAISASGAGWTCPAPAGQTVTCSRASYAVGAANNITINATAPLAAGGVVNTATIGSDTADPTAANNSGSVAVTVAANQSDLSVTKSKSPNPVAQGSAISSSIVVQNNGPNTRTGPISLTDTFVAGERYDGFSGVNWSCTAGPIAGPTTVTCTYSASLANGASATTLVLASTATGTGALANTVALLPSALCGGDPTQCDTNAANDGAVATTVATGQIADLTVAKTIPVVAEQDLQPTAASLTYRVTVTNNGPDASSGITLRDVIPMFVTGTGVAVSGVTIAGLACTTGQTVNCSGGSLANGASGSVDITVTRPMLDGNFTNTVTVDSTAIGDPNRGNNSGTFASIVRPVADLQVAKTVTPGTVAAGTNATYVISVRNNGPSTSQNVHLDDTFTIPGGDTGFTVISIAATGGGSCGGLVAGTSYAAGSPVLACDWASVASGGTQSVTLVIRPNWMAVPPSPRTLPNTAVVSSVTTHDDVAGNNSANATLIITPASLDLLINKTDATAAGAGPDPLGFDATAPLSNVVHYRVRVTNNGPSFASGVVYTDVMTPPNATRNFTFLCDKNAASDACGITPPICNNLNTTYAGVAGTLTCTLPSGIEAGASYTRYMAFQINSQPPGSGDVYNNTVTVTRNEADTNAGNNTATETTTIRVRVNLGVTKTPSLPTVTINQPFTWTIVVSNVGPGDSATTTLTDTLPAGMQFVGATPVTTTQGTCTPAAASFTCNLGNVANGGTATVTVNVRMVSRPAAGTSTNSTTVTTDQVDSVPANNTATGTVTVEKATLTGIVYDDAGGNGVRDGGDPGIAGVSLALTGTDAYGNAINMPAVTNGSGVFLFDQVPPSGPGGYAVTESQPATYTSLVNAFGSAGGTVAADVISGITLTGSTAATGYLFGEFRAPAITGFVYADANNNGAKEVGESGIANVTVQLTGTTGDGQAVSCTTTTIAGGTYTFPLATGPPLCTTLMPGTYALTQTQPAGFIDGLETAGTRGGSTAVNDVISAITLVSGDTASGYLFGETGSGISGIVYVDRNNNALPDPGEPGIPNVTVVLTGIDANGNAVNLTTTTGPTGGYAFLQIPASNATGYTVTETQPAAWGDGQDKAGVSGGSVGNDVVSGIVLATNQFLSGYDFGERGASIAGFVYLDANVNGLRNAGEAPLPGVAITLTGVDFDGNAVNQATVTAADGSYLFEHLARPNAGGYTLTETQPAQYNDGTANVGNAGGVSGANVISAIPLPAGAAGTEYNFGEVVGAYASLSGRVWRDFDHNRTEALARPASGQPGWTVELLKNGNVLQSAVTDASGNYIFTNIPPSASTTDYYSVRFRSPGGYAYGLPVSPDVAGQPTFNTMSLPLAQRVNNEFIRGVFLGAGAAVVQQSLPLDPSGVVYSSLTRQPVPGASVTISGPPGFNAAAHLVGGAANVTQITAADGLYQYLLTPAAPAGVYTIAVVAPAGFLPFPAPSIPACTGALNVVALPAPALVQTLGTAPALGTPLHVPAACPPTSATLAAGAGTTQYYLQFTLTPGVSADVINNHIPLDPILAGAIVVRKTTPKVNVSVGDLVPYTVTAQNTLASALANIDLRDVTPPGFRYQAGSGAINGVRVEPTVSGRTLTWANLAFAANETKTFRLLLVVGAGVGEGEYVNQALALNSLAATAVSNTATAAVRIVPDPTFDCSDIIGKVFDDRNANGYQDEGEPGIPGVRLATARGLLITTDAEGRFHVPCAAVPQADRGSNFVLKLDDRSLPAGYRVTTENPHGIRVTRGKMARINFGATVHRVVRVELTPAAFEAGSVVLLAQWQREFAQFHESLKGRPSVVRIAYKADAGDGALAQQRVEALSAELRRRWKELDCCYHLVIEHEITGARP